jgi:transcriptional regulator with XRE-family HTH domain
MKDINKKHRDLYQARKHICRNIRLLRTIHGYSQKKVAKDLNMPLTTYGHLEAARTMPDLEILHRISDYYQVDLMHLVCFDMQKFLLEYLNHTKYTVPSDTFISQYKELSGGAKLQVRNRLRELIDMEKEFNLYPWNYDK